MMRALEYMALAPGTPMTDVAIDRVFIGSCTNARLEDLRAAAASRAAITSALSVHAMVVPGSERVKLAAEREGLDRIFREAGFEWREPGCSMCLGMNPDILQAGRALGVDEQPELRRAPGPWWTHAPGQPGDGCRGGGHRPLRRRARLELPLMQAFTIHAAPSPRSCAATWTPIRSFRSSS